MLGKKGALFASAPIRDMPQSDSKPNPNSKAIRTVVEEDEVSEHSSYDQSMEGDL